MSAEISDLKNRALEFKPDFGKISKDQMVNMESMEDVAILKGKRSKSSGNSSVRYQREALGELKDKKLGGVLKGKLMSNRMRERFQSFCSSTQESQHF